MKRLTVPTRYEGFIRVCLTVMALLLTFRASAQSHWKDCWVHNQSGIRPELLYGKNPSLNEIHTEIARLATLYNIPLEIIAAVVFQESSVYQFSTVDSFVVHNLCECRAAFSDLADQACGIQKPPGLGLMMITGSTSIQFDWGRLTSDWRYNLEAGVIVLEQKFRETQDTDYPNWMKALERANRHVLENWVYPLEYYHGWKKEGPSYSDTIFKHIAQPPDRISKLFPAVSVTRPSQVISGIAWGRPFVAMADGTWLDRNGQTYIGTVHITGGTSTPVAPIIVTPPASQVANLGAEVKFSVVATGNGELSYRWRRNGVPVGNNSSTLVLKNIDQVDAGTYTVTITGSGGSTSSDLVNLTVNLGDALQIVDGIKLIEPPPYYVGAEPATVEVTIKNNSPGAMKLDRMQVEGDFRDAAGNLMNTISWDARTFGPSLTLYPNETYKYVAGHSQSPFPFLPANVTARLKIKISGVPGLKVVTDAATSANGVLSFKTLDKYECNLSQAPHGIATKNPDQTHYGAGTTVMLTATPNPDYRFAGWRYSDGTIFSSQSPANVVITRNMGVAPHFVPRYPRINVNDNGSTIDLFWPDWGSMFLLEIADVASPQTWQTAGTTPHLVRNAWKVTVPKGPNASSYRLRAP